MKLDRRSFAAAKLDRRGCRQAGELPLSAAAAACDLFDRREAFEIALAPSAPSGT
ncbi:hypothetical protein ACIRVF_42045 [Kitasatospora sp. NPDC101157]|uniref:hypothetical protein n=1 Tax=Kitasatospora sp. NPDC101157 TaxID=3364098 RepID=UPI0038146E92